jgi:hypothetical protein
MLPTSNRYVDQQKIYNVIGREILENAWYLVDYSGKALIAAYLRTDKLEQENLIQ